MVRPEQIEGGGKPLVAVLLQDRDGNLPGLHDAAKAVVAGAEVERFFLEHRRHALGQGLEARIGEHGELELAVAVHELRVSEKVQPVLHRLVESAQQPIVGKGAPLEQLLRLNAPGAAKLVNQQMAHLPAVAHLFRHHAHQAQVVVAVGRGVEEPALLLDGRKLRVPLIDDQIERRVADALVGNVHDRLPAQLALVVTKLDFVVGQLAVLRLELVVAELRRVEANVFLPSVEIISPVVEGRNSWHECTRSRSRESDWPWRRYRQIGRDPGALSTGDSDF